MPFIEIHTNRSMPIALQAPLLEEVTLTVHRVKGDAIVMIACVLHMNAALAMGGDATQPAAIVRMTATGFSEALTAELTRAFSAILRNAFGVPADRMYVFFRDIPPTDRHLVGWNGETFKELRPTL